MPSAQVKNGKYPVVYSNGILRTHNEYKVARPGVVTGRSGTIGKVTFVDEKYWPHNTSLWVTDFCGNDPKYIYYFYIQIRLEKYNAGSTVPTLNRNDVHSIKASIPQSLEEQQKIANFLSSVDTKIEQLNRKKALLEQYKKGMMQKLFSQEVRFKDERGKDYPDWEGIPFTKILKVEPMKKFQIKSSEILNDGPYKVVDQGKELLAGFSDKKSKVFVTDGIIVYGDHTTIVKFVDFNFIVGADGTKVLKQTKGENIKYLYYCLDFNNVKAEGYKRHFSIVKQLYLPVPCREEQQKIANFLSAIDKKIELVSEQLKQARTFKKGLLQQMFI